MSQCGAAETRVKISRHTGETMQPMVARQAWLGPRGRGRYGVWPTSPRDVPRVGAGNLHGTRHRSCPRRGALVCFPVLGTREHSHRWKNAGFSVLFTFSEDGAGKRHGHWEPLVPFGLIGCLGEYTRHTWVIPSGGAETFQPGGWDALCDQTLALAGGSPVASPPGQELFQQKVKA